MRVASSNRHPGEGRDPALGKLSWAPAFAGVTVKGFVLFLVALLLILFGGVNLSTPSHAQESEKKSVIIDKRKLLVQPRNADGTIEETPFLEDPVLWMRTKQQNFYGKMSNAIRQLKSKSATSAAWTLLSISFLYGVFHAAGPGHGKAVVTGWVLATENELRRGVLIAFMSAIIQALTAIVLVSGLLLLVRNAASMARDAVEFLDSTSYLMIAFMGVYLIWNGLRQHRAKTASLSAAAVGPGPFELVSRPEHSLATSHVHDENCGHVHVPAAAALKKEMNFREMFAMSFAVGIRPCSGAILVLLASYQIGFYWAGVVSTLAMGVGVFLTISTIAALAVYSKSTAIRLTNADNPWTVFLARWGKVLIGLCIVGLGSLLFLGSLGTKTLVI